MESLKEAAEIALEDETQISVARRAAGAMCGRLGLTAEAAARAELVCVELGVNVLRHAKRGQLYLAGTPGGRGLQILVVDKGPGIANVQRAMEDGYTTSTTLGVGLGAVKRHVQKLDVYSQLRVGTVVSAAIWDDAAGAGMEEEIRGAVLSTCIAGETLNGDSWVVHRTPERTVYMVVDGLGHGLYASEASGLATRLLDDALRNQPSLAPSELLTRMHDPMRATRGAAVALVCVQGTVATCCGVGNVNVLLVGPDGRPRTLMSHNGTLGHQMRRLQEFRFALDPNTLLLMHSDGLTTHWKLSQYPGILRCAAATIAGVIYRDAVRGRDDATILVSRLNMPNGGEA